MIHEAISKNKHKDMLEVRRQSLINDQKAREFIENVRFKNVEKAKKIQKLEAMTVQKLKKLNIEKLEVFKHRYVQDMTQEEKFKMKREEEILHLEKLELEYVTKLQQTQLMQRVAMEDLEDALSLPLEECAKKFIPEIIITKESPRNYQFVSSMPKIESTRYSSKPTSRENSPVKNFKRSQSTTKTFGISSPNFDFDIEKKGIIFSNRPK